MTNRISTPHEKLSQQKKRQVAPVAKKDGDENLVTFSGTFIAARTQPCPRAVVLRIRKGAHSGSNLSNNGSGGSYIDSWYVKDRVSVPTGGERRRRYWGRKVYGVWPTNKIAERIPNENT